jgi:VWFA-related protein
MRQALVLPLAVALLAGPPTAAQRSPHSEVVTTVVVEVPVNVVHGGAPVRGLTADDFEVYDGRRKQRLVGFEVIDLQLLGAAVSGPVAVPLPARRHFLLLFDLSFSEPSAVVRARHAARDLVARQLHPADLVAVATYTVNTGPRLVLGFTSDRRQIDAAIEDLGIQSLTERTVDPLRLLIVDPATSGERRAGAGAPGRDADALFQEQLRDLTIATSRVERDVNRGQVTSMVRGFQALGQQLRGVQGRKHVVLLSEGVDSSLLLGTEDAGRIEELNEAAASGEFWRIDSDERFGSTASLSVLETMLEELRRADATVHAVDIGGLRAGPEATSRARGEDSLFMMADGTGGELYRNFNDLGGAMSQLLDRTSVTYVLAFQPEDLPMDGSFRRLRVRLEGGPDGARVIHRPGYYAPLPYAEQSAEAKQITAAQLVVGGDTGGPIPLAALAAPVRGSGELAYVPLLIEIGGPALLGAKPKPNEPLVLDVFAYALDGGGAVRDFFSQQVGLDLAQVEPLLRRRGVKFFGHLDLPPGEYTLRILVRDVANGRTSVQAASLAVPRLAEQQAALLPPLFPHPPGDWLMVREQVRAGKQKDVPYPFMLDGQPFLPASRPVIAPGGQADLVLMAYHAAVGGRRLDGRVLDGSGAEVGAAVLQQVGGAAGGQAGLEQLKARLQAASLRPGDYVLEVRLTEPASGEVLVSSIPFIVGS